VIELLKVAFYGRVSSEDQAERRTIENQVEFVTKYADLHQMGDFEKYLDDGVTGTIPLEERKEGRRLLEDAKSGKFNLLLIYRLDRLGRSARVILNAVYELEQYGVKIRSMTEPFDTGDPNGRFLLTILAGVADLERETILSRMWHGANRAARSGKWLGGIVPYGYKLDDEGCLEPNYEPLPGMDISEVDVINLIYNLVANQRYSTIKVADYLNALGAPPSYAKDNRQITSGKRKVNTSGIWRPARIRNMIINTTYKGIHYYGKRSKKDRDLIPREVPAIVSEELWENAQKVLKENQIEAMRNSKRQYLLRGLITCGICGLTYHGTAFNGPKGQPKAYYLCGGKTAYRGPLQGRCTSKNVPQEWIENIVWNDCLNFILNPGEALNELSSNMQVKKNHTAGLLEEIKIIEKAIYDKEIEKQSILDLYRKKIINSTDVEKQLGKIEQERNSLKGRISLLEKQIESEDTLADQFDTAEELLMQLQEKIKDEPTFEVKRDIVKTLVREVKIETENNEYDKPVANVSVNYTFSKVVLHTDNRAEINLGIIKERRLSLVSSSNIANTPGVRIREKRLEKNLTIRDLSKLTKISETTINKIELNKHFPSILSIRKISTVLNTPIYYIGCFENLPEETLGQKIRKARLYKGLTKRELAKELGVNERTIRHWEDDKQEPSYLYASKVDKLQLIIPHS
jgi:site-specific DNA recombinase